MNKGEYLIMDDFQVGEIRVLVLDRNFEFEGTKEKVIIDGETFSYVPNSVRKWITLKSTKEFKGRIAIFT